jgi:hypothetical protein
MSSENQPIDAPPVAAKPRRRRWPWIVLTVVLATVVFVGLLPHLASIGPVRDFLFRVALPRIDGSVHAGSARLGWFSPIQFENVEIRSRDGEPAVSIARLVGDRSLWRMILGSDLGEIRIERPQINVVIDKDGTNLRRIFPRHRPPNVALAVKLVDGRVSVRGADSAEPWTLDPVNLSFRLRPSTASADRLPRLEIEPGVVVANTQLTTGACRDLLKYIAPVLAGATEASGHFSIDLDRWEVPLNDFAQGQGSGRLTIHDLTVGPGPLVHELAAVLKVPPKTVAVENTPVTFRLADGRMHHSQLTFRLQRLVISTTGSVGVADGSLAMMAELSLPEQLLAERPVLAALAKGKLRIPITGTLQKPKVDGKALVRSLLNGSEGGGLDSLLKNGQADLGQLVDTIRQRREERRKQQKLDQQSAPSTSPNQNNEPRRPLRNLIRGVLDEAAKGADNGQ